MVIHKKRAEQTDGYWGQVILGDTKRPGRIFYLDYLRVLAAVLVILVHVLSSVMEEMTEPSTARTVIAVVNSFCLSCNLLFLMISGAIIMNMKPEKWNGSVLTFYRRRLLRVLIPCFAYYLFYAYNAHGVSYFMPANWIDLVRHFVANDTGMVPHFWLMFVIVTTYFAVPLLALGLQAMTDRMLDGLAIAVLVLHAVYVYGPMLGFNFVSSTFLASWESLIILGYYCTTKAAVRHYRLIMVGGGCAALFMIYAVVTLDHYDELIYNNALPMVLLTASIFMFFRKHKDDLFAKGSKLLSVLSKYSFSILLMHWFILFEVVEKQMSLGGILLPAVLTLILGTLFAILFDNTVVLVMDTVINAGIDFLCRICGKRTK
ncbi:MAG: acyltransferase [Lachnospiraceae bacterium]|nr:acyltransferase [Lachnospiraceae bacterium]